MDKTVLAGEVPTTLDLQKLSAEQNFTTILGLTQALVRETLPSNFSNCTQKGINLFMEINQGFCYPILEYFNQFWEEKKRQENITNNSSTHFQLLMKSFNKWNRA